MYNKMYFVTRLFYQRVHLIADFDSVNSAQVKGVNFIQNVWSGYLWSLSYKSWRLTQSVWQTGAQRNAGVIRVKLVVSRMTSFHKTPIIFLNYFERNICKLNMHGNENIYEHRPFCTYWLVCQLTHSEFCRITILD